MRRNTMSFALGLLALVLWVLPAGTALAGDENTAATGNMIGRDINQGTGLQLNADEWKAIGVAMAGEGNQTTGVAKNANTGSGAQDNTGVASNNWEWIGEANSGSGAQLLGTANSNGGDRVSDDILVALDDDSSVGSSALEATVSGNAVGVAAIHGGVDSVLEIDERSGFSDLYGVSAIAASSGANSSQNVSVNVTADVGAGSAGGR